ncbi:uncharacterized protein OCT59_000440 [Rhizophagus irregularis]|uniref:UBX domain-containing protein n=1 Tax=Rhizophagus irregularis (strain DAOM 181602 / DAOM 197198 / MUCL 43194) TaxID=747089 RepID=U9TWX6_RHIID|nr:hypothetical protein OCT59_000440 [Rhizophagus irregularis]GBC47939.2 hypothetical protein GLOIN_2v1470067 [Rhizophagus irregularis DAOM 181602=DAOM 197198]
MLKFEPRNRALLAIKEDRIRNKQRKYNWHMSGNKESNIGISIPVASQPETSSKPSQNTALIQIHLSTGQAIREKFSSSTKFLIYLDEYLMKNEPSIKFQLMLPLPRKVFKMIRWRRCWRLEIESDDDDTDDDDDDSEAMMVVVKDM